MHGMKSFLIFCLVALGMALGLHCGGSTQATVPGPPPLTLTVETPGDGIVVSAPSLHLRGSVSQANATVAINRQLITVRPDGRFESDCTLAEGTNTLTIEAWTEATVKAGLGSGLLPPSGKAEARVIRQVKFERPPLLLSVSVPEAGATFAASRIQSLGVASESDATLTINGQPVSLNENGVFSTTLTLQAGTNTFTYLATGIGKANRTATVIRTVTYIPPPDPTVTLSEPIEGLLTNAAQVRVVGRVVAPAITLTVNGQATPMDAQGAFTSLLSPAEGPLTITALAVNSESKACSDVRHIVIDRTPPHITLTRSVPALVNSRTLDLQGVVDDPSAMLSLNNQGLPLDASGVFHASYGLSEGPNHRVFRAVDAAGNVGTLSVDTVCDTIAPVVSIDTPLEGLVTNAASVEVKGHVDDPTAALLVAGISLKPNADGSFTTFLTPSEGAQLIVALATDAAGNTGHATRSITVDRTPPVLQWLDPTPAESAQVTKPFQEVQASVSEPAVVVLNGLNLVVKTSDNAMNLAAPVTTPYVVQSTQTCTEGQVVLVLEATDRAGNASRIERRFQCGLTTPRVILESPAEGWQTTQDSATLLGHVEASDFVKPLSLTLNGSPVQLGADLRFSLPVSLQEGSNAFKVLATNAFHQTGEAVRTVYRFNSTVSVHIDWPMEGLAIPQTSVEVRGHVFRPNCTVAVNGVPTIVDSSTLTFQATLPLQAGLNTLQAVAQDAAGNQGTDQVHVTSATADSSASYRWDLPANGTSSRTRTVHITGQADLPGITQITVNGVPMALRGQGKGGQFTGEIPLTTKGPSALLLEAHSLNGTSSSERRNVSFVPELPRLRLLAPDAARPGDTLPIQVSPEAGSHLVKAELTWNGRSLATVTDPFAAVQALVPADAVVGSQISVEALGTDVEGETVLARTYVTVYGQGALVLEAYDDRLGLPLTDMTAKASLEGGESQPFDAHGRAALATALPQNWVKVEKVGFTPVWRSAGLTIGSAQNVMGARLTKLEDGKDADASGFHGEFAGGALKVDLGAHTLSGAGKLSATPLSTQGLPGLLPLGWSVVSGWWLELSGTAQQAPGSAAVMLPTAAPALPVDARYNWVRWDSSLHQWMTLAGGLSALELGNLPWPSSGGYALVIADPAPTAPPTAMVGSVLPGFPGKAWQDGLAATGSVDPAIMPTVDAIRGARATAKFGVTFQDGYVVPSGAPIQAEVLESYTMLDQSLIEPDGFSQDAVAARWMLEVIDGKPMLMGAAEGLGLRLPVRMSRSFSENELVEGRIFVGFYHDGVQVAQSGSELLGASGGVVNRDGVKVSFASGALLGTTLVRLSVDSGDVAPLWPELAGKGTIAKSFNVDIVGTLLAGLGLSLDAMVAPDNARPLVLQRRIVQGERLVVAVGELRKQGSTWALVTPSGGNAILEGGSFAVLVSPLNWDWVSGLATLPGCLAQPLMAKLGVKARMMPVKQLNQASVAKASLPSSADDVVVADVIVDGSFFPAISGTRGAFAVPVSVPTDITLITVKGERRDLGVTGSFSALVPSADNSLRLTSVPFRVMTIIPAEMSEVGVGSVVEVLLSTAADPTTLTNARLFREPDSSSQLVAPQSAFGAPAKATQVQQPSAKPVPTKKIRNPARKAASSKGALLLQGTPSANDDIPLRRSLSQDGRTLFLTPESPLAQGSAYRVVTDGLSSISGERAPDYQRRFRTLSQVQFLDADLSRIQLTYPTDAFDVTVTIPEGALPPWSIVEIEAPGMGSYGSGVMPPTGSLTFQLKAHLGERLTVTVQLRDGRALRGTIGRYVSEDGRTTLGQDGGRVEGPNGLAVVLPKDALDGPTELTVESLPAMPTLAEGFLMEGEVTAPGLRIRASQPVILKKPPVVELPASALPANADTQPSPAFMGNGPLAIFQKEIRTLPDGSQDEMQILVDTAEVRETPGGRVIVSLGGLRLPDPEKGTVVQQHILKLLSPGAVASAKGTINPTPLQNSKTAPDKASFYGGSGLGGALLDLFLLGFPQQAPLEYRYHSGTVVRNWNGLGTCGGTASAGCYGYLPGAEVYRHSGTAGIDQARMGRLAKGRMLATADEQGRYLSVGGPMAGAVLGQTWIDLFAVDPRTGETSIDPGAVSPQSLGLPRTTREHSLTITSMGGNPFDPTLTAPRIRARLVDGTGTARTMFTVGENATLQVFTETSSQPVVRGKVSGSHTKDFGALPADLPVQFTAEGTWKVDILGWTAKPVQGATSLSAVVTPVGQLGPSLPGKPTILTKDPGEGDQGVDPSAIIKLTFSEPVKGATAFAFALRVNEVRVPFKVISNAREVTEDSALVQQVWLVPEQRLSLGAKVTVGATSFLVDQNGDALDNVSWSFLVRGADEVGSLANVGEYSEMVVANGTIYTVEKIRESVGSQYGFDIAGAPIQAIRMIDITDPSAPKLGPSFGAHGSWDPMGQGSTYYAGGEPFSKHEVHGLRVAKGVAIGGKARDLLLVTTRPRQVVEMASWSSDGENTYRSRHNAIWVFDITGDDTSFGENRTPKLLMCSSLGTLSDTWAKGLGSAGGVLGTIRLRGGLTLWNAEAWWNSFREDANALSVQSLVRRTRIDIGYFPSPTAVVAANGFYDPAASGKPSVTSAVVTEDQDGHPIAFATMGYSEGLLTFIDGKVGDPLATATFTSGGPKGMDGRIHDLSAAVNREPANLVEVLKGTWQGNNGTEQGTLLLAATAVADTAHFWVLKPYLTNPNDPGAAQLALAELPGRISKIQVDPPKMLVGVQAGGKVYIFDLKTFQMASNSGPMALTPIFEFAANGAWTMADGLLFDDQLVSAKVVIKNLDGSFLRSAIGAPITVDANTWLKGVNYEYNNAFVNNLPNVIRPVNTFPSRESGSEKSSFQKKSSVLTQGLPRKLIYAMASDQGTNNGYMLLRYYYPDLGDMQITGIAEYADPVTFIEMTNANSLWIMTADANLYKDGTRIENAVAITGLKVVPGDNGETNCQEIGMPESKIYGDGDRAKFELDFANKTDREGNAVISEWKRKFAYAPFAIRLKNIGGGLDLKLRSDRTDSYRIKITMNLYKSRGDQQNRKPACQERQMEFIVKYNATTTLFDVIRGGVWHFDPDVSAPSPANTGANPAMKTWTNFLNANCGNTEATLSDPFGNRLSLTSRTIVPAGNQSDGQHLAVEGTTYDFGDMGLDEVQNRLNRIMPALRRRVFDIPNQRSQTTWTILPQRMTFSSLVPTDNQLTFALAGDPPGSFGYRMAHTLNAIQAFKLQDVGMLRDLNTPENWASDPAITEIEKNPFPEDPVKNKQHAIITRIAPVIHQVFKDATSNFLSFSPMVQYMVAYPKLRAQGTENNGLYPINTLLTRDLLVGSMGDWTSGKDSVTGETFQAQRERIDTLMMSISQKKNRNDAKPKMLELKEALKQQTIVAGQGSYFSDTGAYFNRGLGILQLALTDRWNRFSIDAIVGQKFDPPTYQAPHTLYMTDDPKDWNYLSPGFNGNILSTVSDSLFKHLTSNRVDILINGVDNLPDEADKAAVKLQQFLDAKRGLKVGDEVTPESLPYSDHTLVICQYNLSAKRYYGGLKKWYKLTDVVDIGECVTLKQETADLNRLSTNQDVIRLMATVNAMLRTVYSRDYQVAFYKANKEPKFSKQVWHITGPDTATGLYYSGEVKALDTLLEEKAPYLKVQEGLLIEKTKDRLEDEIKFSTLGMTELQILQVRKAMLLHMADLFKEKLKAEVRRLDGLLRNLPIRLHAHSQSAIHAAVIGPRLPHITSERLDVMTGKCNLDSIGPESIDLLTYGGGANMYDFGPDSKFRTYTHHVNKSDLVASLVGMNDPFGFKVASIKNADPVILGNVINLSEHGKLIRTVPPANLWKQWVENHKVIYYNSSNGC